MSETVPENSTEEISIIDERRVAWLRDHAGLLATLAYLFLVIVGVVYEALLLLRFRVNILYYAEAADFILVPFREPLVTIAAVAPIPFWILYMRFSRWLGKKYPVLTRPERRMSPELLQRMRLYTTIAGMTVWSLAATMSYASRVSQQILDGKRRAVRLDLGSGGSVTGPVIASTSQWMFVWEDATKHTRAVPLDNIAQIVVFRTTKVEKTPKTAPPVAVPQ